MSTQRLSTALMGFCGVIALEACTANDGVTPSPWDSVWSATKGNMVGMTHADIVQCAGIPTNEEALNPHSVSMSYLIEKQQFLGTLVPEHARCQANLTLVDDKVVSITETAVLGTTGIMQCVNRFRACTK